MPFRSLASSAALLLPLLLAGVLGGCGPTSKADRSPPEDLRIYDEAVALYDAGNFPEALALFDDLWVRFPDSIRHDNAGYRRGRCRYALADYSGGVANFDALRASHPDTTYFASADYWSGRSRVELADWNGAIPEFADSLARDPAGIWADNAQYWSGRARYETTDFAGAIGDLAALETSFPTSSYLDDARLFRGLSRYALLQYATSEGDFLGVIAVGPGQWDDNAWYWLGRARYEQTNLAGAYAAFESLVTSQPAGAYADNGLYWQVRIRVDQTDCDAAQVKLSVLEAQFAASSSTSAAASYFDARCGGN